MDKELAINMVKNYIVNSEWNINLSDFDKNGLVLKQNNLKYGIKIIGFNNATIVSTSKNFFNLLEKNLVNKNRDIIFECPLTYGQTIFYIPNFYTNPIIDNTNFKIMILSQDELSKYDFNEEFENSITYDNNKNCITKIACVCFYNDKIIACCGGIELDKNLFEIGVDVLPPYRKQGIATRLCVTLKNHLLKNNILPVWRASVTNLHSQQVAQNSGFSPLYISSFGTIGDKFYAFNNLMGIDKKFKFTPSRI